MPMPLIYRVVVSMLITKKAEDGVRFLLLKRGKGQSFPNVYGMPGGKLEPTDKDFLAGALRELKEETGIARINITNPNLLSVFSSLREPGVIFITYIARLKSHHAKVELEEQFQEFVWSSFKESEMLPTTDATTNAIKTLLPAVSNNEPS